MQYHPACSSHQAPPDPPGLLPLFVKSTWRWNFASFHATLLHKATVRSNDVEAPGRHIKFGSWGMVWYGRVHEHMYSVQYTVYPLPSAGPVRTWGFSTYQSTRYQSTVGGFKSSRILYFRTTGPYHSTLRRDERGPGVRTAIDPRQVFETIVIRSRIQSSRYERPRLQTDL